MTKPVDGVDYIMDRIDAELSTINSTNVSTLYNNPVHTQLLVHEISMKAKTYSIRPVTMA